MSNDNWEKCPAGTLSGARKEQQQRENSSVMARRAALGILVTAGVTFGVINRQSVPTAQNLSCEAVIRMAPDYIAGSLNEQNMVSIQAHLGHCPKCDQHIQHLQKSPLA